MVQCNKPARLNYIVNTRGDRNTVPVLPIVDGLECIVRGIIHSRL